MRVQSIFRVTYANEHNKHKQVQVGLHTSYKYKLQVQLRILINIGTVVLLTKDFLRAIYEHFGQLLPLLGLIPKWPLHDSRLEHLY